MPVEPSAETQAATDSQLAEAGLSNSAGNAEECHTIQESCHVFLFRGHWDGCYVEGLGCCAVGNEVVLAG